MDKQGALGNQLFVIVFFIIIILIAAGISAGTLIYFSGEQDYRLVHGQTVLEIIKKCMVDKKISIDELEKKSSDLYSKCGINELSFSKSVNLKICLNSKTCEEDSNWLFRQGSNFESCLFNGAKSNLEYPRCIKEEIILEDERIVIVSYDLGRISNEL